MTYRGACLRIGIFWQIDRLVVSRGWRVCRKCRHGVLLRRRPRWLWNTHKLYAQFTKFLSTRFWHRNTIKHRLNSIPTLGKSLTQRSEDDRPTSVFLSLPNGGDSQLILSVRFKAAQSHCVRISRNHRHHSVTNNLFIEIIPAILANKRRETSGLAKD